MTRANPTQALWATLLALPLAFGGGAQAADNDPSLYRFQLADGSPDQEAFADYARELGMALAPKLLAPADTLGVSGFHFATELSITNINESEAYWQQGVDDSSPPGSLVSTQLTARKGLPFSFEIGGTATYMLNSEMWVFGAEGKWALNEAIDDFPIDFAVRGAYSRMVGSSQLNLSTFGLDAILSRGFGVGGVVNMAPYMAYSPLWVYASSEVLDPTPGVANDPRNNFVLDEEDAVLHRFVFGLRFIFAHVNFTPEAALTKGVQTFSFNLGLDY